MTKRKETIWAQGFVDLQHLAPVKGRVTKTLGGPGNPQQALEGISLPIANKEANQPAVERVLKNDERAGVGSIPIGHSIKPVSY